MLSLCHSPHANQLIVGVCFGDTGTIPRPGKLNTCCVSLQPVIPSPISWPGIHCITGQSDVTLHCMRTVADRRVLCVVLVLPAAVKVYLNDGDEKEDYLVTVRGAGQPCVQCRACTS
jgi:hypothetical protein